jgi:hypothetical protein
MTTRLCDRPPDGGYVNMTWNGTELVMPGGGSISFVLNGQVLFNTDTVDAAGIPCNRSYSHVALSDWNQWAEPLSPPTGGNLTHSVRALKTTLAPACCRWGSFLTHRPLHSSLIC